MLIEKLLKETEFKKDAIEIARQLAKCGIDRLELLADAPGRLQSATVWGHPLSKVIDAINAAANKPTIQTKPLNEMAQRGHETPMSEPGKPVGGIK